MKIRRGIYTVYKGQEVGLIYPNDRNKSFCIRIRDKKLVNEKCIKHNDNLWIRRVTADEIGEVYEVRPYYVLYKGYKLWPMGGNEVKTYITEYDVGAGRELPKEIINEFGLELVGRAEYQKAVPNSEIDEACEQINYLDKEILFNEEKEVIYKTEYAIVESPTWK